MKFEQVIKSIDDRNFHPVYFLCGEEAYFIDRISKKLENEVLNASEREFNQTVLYGLDTDIDAIISIAKRYPMMSEYNVVLVKEAQLLKKIEELEAYVKNPVSSTILVVCYKNKKLDKRKSLYKSLGKNTLYFESNKLYENQVPDWIMNELSHAGFHISARNASLLTEYLGNDLSNIHNELSKLILNLPEGSTINGEEIQTHIGINKEYNTFELNTALGHRNVVKANKIIAHFAQNEKKYPIPFIVATLYGHFTKILKYHAVIGKSKKEQASFIGVNPFFLNDYETGVKNYSVQKITEVIHILKEYDLKSKGVGNASVNDGELMKEMVYKILH